MRIENVVSMIVGATTLVAGLTGDAQTASALHCPAAPGSFTWGTCNTDSDEPGGQTVREASAEISPPLDCAETEVEIDRSGPRDWCRRYALRLTNNCDEPLEFDQPVVDGANRRILTDGESAVIVGLEACTESSRSDLTEAMQTASDAGLPPPDTSGPDAGDTATGPTDATGDTDIDATPGPTDATGDTGVDAADGNGDTDRDVADSAAADTGTSLRDICAAFDDDLTTAGEHSATYAFSRAGERHELTQTSTTISFESWYSEECGDDHGPLDAGTGGPSRDSGSSGAAGGSSCGCRASGPIAPLPGEVLMFAVLFGLVRGRRTSNAR